MMPRQNKMKNVAIGIATLIGCHVGAFIVLGFLLYISEQLQPSSGMGYQAESSQLLLMAILGIGLTQLLYVVPLFLRLGSIGRYDRAKGVAICAVITALLNGSCYLLFLTSY